MMIKYKGVTKTAATIIVIVGALLIYLLSQQIPYVNLIDIDSSLLVWITVISVLFFFRPSVLQAALFSLGILLVLMLEHMLYLSFLDQHAGIILFLILFYILLLYIVPKAELKKK